MKKMTYRISHHNNELTNFQKLNRTIMYNSIYFETLQLHASHDVDAHTLSKTVAVYQNDFYVFNDLVLFKSSKEIKKTIREKSNESKGKNAELYQYFSWYLN